ncbi:MAG TPA: M14 family zinc carboxypeptidase [Planctomycetota bacterium]|nr:M14 family zinc carboxypeptidase [Planctomycetota bacterium]
MRPAARVAALLVAAAAAAAQESRPEAGAASAPAPTSRPASPDLPTPEAWFGRRPGADRFLASWDSVRGYFAAVDRASDRVEVEECGRSVDGAPMIVAYVSAPKNLARRAEIVAYNRRVARGEASAEEIRGGGFPATVLLTAGVHATEFTGTQAAPELLWLLASGAAPDAERLLDGVLFALVPCANPDGLEIVRSWYERTLDGPWEGTWPPVLYHRYCGHDNNRDAYMLTQPESRALNRLLYHALHPQLYVDQHHMGASDARMFIGETYSPLNPSVDPLTATNVQLVGAYMRAAMTAEGKRGLLHRANWSGFWQGGFFTNAWWHHIPAILTETATMRLATPLFQRPEDLDGSYFRGVGKDGNRKDWNHPWPWTGGWWRARDGVEYDLSAALHSLDAAAVFRAKLALDRRAAALRSIAEGAAGPTTAWLLTAPEVDAGAADRLARLLALGGADVGRTTAPLEVRGRTVPAGAWVVPAAQPFRGFARDLLEPQEYPDRRGPDGLPETPFDRTGWTLAMQTGVRVDALRGASPAFEPLRLDDADTLRPPAPTAWRPPEGAARRVGLYRPWTTSMDEGWTRWILERHGAPYVPLFDDDVRAGGLGARVDVVLLCSIAARELRDGHAPGAMPPEYCGGLGDAGAAALVAFVREGGRLVCLDDACEYALEIFGREALPIVDVTATLSPRDFWCPGALLAVNVRAGHPETGRLPPELVVPFGDSPAFDVAADASSADGVRTLATYATTRLLRSGRMAGEARIAGKAAAVACTVGAGSVTLIGPPVQFRAQSEASFPLLLDALYR